MFIQWPNDVMLRGRKIAGILAEARGHAARELEVVVGVVSASLYAGEPFGVRQLLGAALIIAAGVIEVLRKGPPAAVTR